MKFFKPEDFAECSWPRRMGYAKQAADAANVKIEGEVMLTIKDDSKITVEKFNELMCERYLNNIKIPGLTKELREAWQDGFNTALALLNKGNVPDEK